MQRKCNSRHRQTQQAARESAGNETERCEVGSFYGLRVVSGATVSEQKDARLKRR
jgi:hypothetical protein